MTEVKAIAIGVLVIALALGGYIGFRMAFDSGLTAGKAEVQTEWDADKINIQKVADVAIASAMKQRDDAIENNQVIHDQYEKQVAGISANAADFARRLRNAEAIITAGGRSTGKADSGPAPATAGQTSSADQFGRLLTLITDFHTECQANADQLDALIAEIKPQL